MSKKALGNLRQAAEDEKENRGERVVCVFYSSCQDGVEELLCQLRL
jgi:hypothetical protein